MKPDCIWHVARSSGLLNAVEFLFMQHRSTGTPAQIGLVPNPLVPNPLADEPDNSEAPARMIHPENVVSIHPYFRVKPGKMAEAKNLLSQMVSRTATEEANLYYDFTINGDVVFCREAYVEAEGLLKHLENVGPVLAEYLKLADVLRVEVHGTAASLGKLKGPLAGLKPEWFVFERGVSR
jgi:quinol monooxygenase YgiN